MADYSEDYYRVLGLPPNASQAEIRAAWLRLISYWHPDRTNHQAAEARSKELNRAYQVLFNESSRADYDRWYQSQERIAAGETWSDYVRWPRRQKGAARERADQASTAPAAGPPPAGPPPAGPPPAGPPPAGPPPAGPPPRTRPSWQPPPTDYSHHPGVDPFTGTSRAAGGSAQAQGYLVWTAGLAAWLVLLGISTRIGGAASSPALVTAIFVVDVMCLWTWLFGIAAVFRRDRRHWVRFWGAELLGALTATSVTLLLAAIGIAGAALLSPSGLNAFRQRAWVGVALAALLLAGGVGVLTFRFFLQRWADLKEASRHVPESQAS